MNVSNKSNGLIYLSGGMQFAEDLGSGWRKHCSEKLTEINFTPLDIAKLDILYSTTHSDLTRCFDIDEPGELLQKKSNIRKHFIETDTKLIIQNTDAMIVLYDESVRLGAGTLSECQVAYDHNIPIFLVNGFAKVSAIPGWLQAQTTKMFSSFRDLHLYLKELPPFILNKHIATEHQLCFLCGTSFVAPIYEYTIRYGDIPHCPTCKDVVHTTNTKYYNRLQFFHETLFNTGVK